MLFALGLVTALLLRHGGSLWAVLLGTAVCSPLVVVIAVVLIAARPPHGRQAWAWPSEAPASA